MSFSTSTTAIEQADMETGRSELPKSDFSSSQPVNTDSRLPTHHLPLCAHTQSPPHSPQIPSTTHHTLSGPGKTNTWLSHVKEYAPVVGVVGTIIGVVVAIITVVVE